MNAEYGTKRAYRYASGFAIVTASVVALAGSGSHANAAESAKSIYLLGSSAGLAGVVPPPGIYFSDINYYYSGSASGAAADSILLGDIGAITREARLSVDSNAFVTIPAILWVPQAQLFGGRFGVGVLAPIGWQEATGRVDVETTLTLPNGHTFAKGSHLRFGDETTNFGDPLVTAFLGWDTGNWHTKVTGLLNIPIGAYDPHNLVNMGFNRWAFDASGAVTWLDPRVGLEVSVAAGFTFNGENPDTDYRTGTEFHVEYAVMQHLSEAFSVGFAGYYYEQITGDSGSGAVLGPFEGQVAAIGPNLAYNFTVGGHHVATTVRWLHEFDARNRPEGDAVFATLAVPF